MKNIKRERRQEGKRASFWGFLPSCLPALLLLFTIFLSPVSALELDTSIDDDIRRNYNPNKIEQDNPLPDLPKILSEPNYTPPKQVAVSKSMAQGKIKSSKESYITLKQGTKIKVKLLNNISDRTKKGTMISFVSLYPVSTTYFTIPSGTVFKGEIVNSHRPQFTANGGLIVIRINSAIINGATQPISAFVTKADSKKIFFNNIKGKRKYLSSMVKSTKNGRHFFKKMMRVTSNLAQDGSSIILTPFSLTAGVLTLGGNVIVAPVLAVFHKGGTISIPEGSNFDLKLSQDVFIYN